MLYKKLNVYSSVKKIITKSFVIIDKVALKNVSF